MSDEIPRFDRAWGVLFGASICMSCGIPSVIYYTFGLFVSEIIADTHWPAAVVAAAIGPAAGVVALIGPLIGQLSDRLGVRKLALFGGPAFAIGMALLGWAATGPASFTLLTVVMFVLAGFAGSPIPYAQALTGWFDQRRGLALGIMFSLGAVGIAVWPMVAADLIAQVGWRRAYVTMGLVAGGAIFLAAIFFLRDPPKRSLAQGNGSVPGLTMREALATAKFWKIAAVFLMLSAVLGGTAVQFPIILHHKGIAPQTAAKITSVIGMFMFAGRLLLGAVLDRWFAPWVTAAVTALSSLSFVLIMETGSQPFMMVAAALLGFGIGTEYAVAAYMTSRAFGYRSYGAVYGLIVLATGIGLGAGPALIGLSLVSNVSGTLIFGTALSLMIASAGLLLTFQHRDLPYGQSL